ncbi:MAG: helix-hairpin-helix domain-containing protein [Verrucomicrobiae bacterium]|nr:helix-hairpin-helix domain-containing protein [Verrucomicrobiae bacterium]MDW8343231.1 helix-hairpin-helix domain-containing protein [Verrucomicrobiae bacterium]
MKWLFSKPKPEPATPALVTPPRPSGAAVDLKKTQVIQFHETPASAPVSANTVPVPLRSFLDQFPANFLAPDARLTQAVVEFPHELIIPQLSRGKITLPLRDVVGLLPSNLVVGPLTPDIENHPIQLPTHEVVGALPPDLFALNNQAPVDLNSAEFDDVPRLFDDSFLEEILAEPKPVASSPGPVAVQVPTTAAPKAPPAPTPVETRLSAQSAVPATASRSATTPASDELPDEVHVKLRNLVAVLPESALSGSRAELLANVPADARVAIPTEVVLPLLSTGKIRLPVAQLASWLPAGLLKRGAAAQDEQIIIPISEIVSQLPASAFQPVAAPPPAVVAEDSVDAVLVEPFVEAGIVASASAVSAPAASPEPGGSPLATPASEQVVEEPPVVPAGEPVSSEAGEVEAAEESVEPSDGAAAPLFDSAAFLAKLNRITAEELAQINGLSRSLIKRLLEHRAARTQFRTLEEVRQIPGFTRKAFEALAGACPESLSRLLGVEHNRELSLRDVVRLTTALPGVAGCVLASTDGLVLTAQLPGGLDENRLSAFAPQLFRKITEYTEELGVGDVQRFTLFTTRQPVSIFRAGGIYLVILHDPQHFSKALLRRVSRIAEELARLCRLRAVE